MSRRRTITLIAASVVVVLVVSAGLARVYANVSAERAGVTELIQDEARGDQAGMLGLLYHCRANAFCRARVAADAASLHMSGSVTVVQLIPSSSFPLGGNVGTARISWTAGSSLPVTQCVRVKHAGNPITGLHVELLEISARIKTSGDCPKRY